MTPGSNFLEPSESSEEEEEEESELSGNVWVKGSLRPDGSVTTHL